jgi:hypothetical protein
LSYNISQHEGRNEHWLFWFRYGGESRDPNYNAASNYFKEFLESEAVGLMNEDEGNTFEEWVENNENAQELVCQIEVIEQFGTWMCDCAEKSTGEPLSKVNW